MWPRMGRGVFPGELRADDDDCEDCTDDDGPDSSPPMIQRSVAADGLVVGSMEEAENGVILEQNASSLLAEN